MYQWRPIATARKTSKGPFGPWLILGHREKKWIRFGRYYEASRKWYYSGTNERAQYSQTEGDEPTHWAPMPDINTIGEDD